MNYLVTGGCGFIGSHFVELLLANLEPNDKIVIVDATYRVGKVFWELIQDEVSVIATNTITIFFTIIITMIIFTIAS